MGKDLITSNLIRKRAYLAGEIEAGQRRLRQQKSQLYTIDRMLRLLDAGINPNTIKAIRPWQHVEGFRHGDQTRLVLTVLRQSKVPLLAREITEAIAAHKGVEITSDLRSRVRATVTRLTGEGRLQKSGKPRTVRWTLPG